MTAGDSFWFSEIWMFPSSFSSTNLSVLAAWYFSCKKGKWVVLELPCFQWLNLKKLKRMLKSDYGKIEKNGRASHHSPIRLNSQTRRTSILRITAGFCFFFLILFFSVIDWQTIFLFLLRVSWRFWVPKKAELTIFGMTRVKPLWRNRLYLKSSGENAQRHRRLKRINFLGLRNL